MKKPLLKKVYFPLFEILPEYKSFYSKLISYNGDIHNICYPFAIHYKAEEE
jgi:hypothetical protein